MADDDFESKLREILEDLVFHTIKNSPKNIVRIFIINFLNSQNIW